MYNTTNANTSSNANNIERTLYYPFWYPLNSILNSWFLYFYVLLIFFRPRITGCASMSFIGYILWNGPTLYISPANPHCLESVKSVRIMLRESRVCDEYDDYWGWIVAMHYNAIQGYDMLWHNMLWDTKYQIQSIVIAIDLITSASHSSRRSTHHTS
jgi:hypothetical protein